MKHIATNVNTFLTGLMKMDPNHTCNSVHFLVYFMIFLCMYTCMYFQSISKNFIYKSIHYSYGGVKYNYINKNV